MCCLVNGVKMKDITQTIYRRQKMFSYIFLFLFLILMLSVRFTHDVETLIVAIGGVIVTFQNIWLHKIIERLDKIENKFDFSSL